jgi:hypothetical protein
MMPFPCFCSSALSGPLERVTRGGLRSSGALGLQTQGEWSRLLRFDGYQGKDMEMNNKTPIKRECAVCISR